LTVIDENWIGDNPNKEKTQIFWHSGTLSSFLESTLEIAIPSEMTAQIVSQRIGRATQPSMPHISTAKGGFFESKQDLFSLKPSEITNPKTEKEKEDEAVNAQLEELAKVPLTPEQEANKKIREKKNEIAEAREALAKINEKVQANSNDATTEIRGSGMGQYVVKVDGVDLAAAKKEYADKFKDVTALEAELEAAQNEKWQVKRDAYESKQAAISNNLSKIEIVPNPQLLDAPKAMTETNDLNNPNTFDERFRIYTFDDKSFDETICAVFSMRYLLRTHLRSQRRAR
jgi:hypothetical protein